MPRTVKAVAVLTLLAAVPLSDLAEGAPSYPTRPIRIIAPFAPGGGSDVMARLVAQKLTEAFKQQAVVENRAGAGGRVGTELVARSTPDGYTLLLTVSGAIIFAPALFPNVPTVSESGLPGFETVTYYGVLAPAGTPADIVAQINTALVKGLHSPDTRKRLEADGSELRTSTPEEFARVIKTDTEKWTKVIRAAGIKPES